MMDLLEEEVALAHDRHELRRASLHPLLELGVERQEEPLRLGGVDQHDAAARVHHHHAGRQGHKISHPGHDGSGPESLRSIGPWS